MIKKKKGLTILVLIAMLLLTACASNTGTDQGANQKQAKDAKQPKTANLKLLVPGEKPQHYDKVMGILNEKLSNEIQVTLDIQYTPWDSYKDQLLVKLAAGEDFDFYYNGWWQNYAQVLSRSGAMDVTDLLETHAPDLYNGLTKAYVDANRYKGKIYGIPIPGPLEYPKGYKFRSDLAEKYNVSPDSLTTLQGIYDFQKKVIAEDSTRVGNRFNGQFAGNYEAVAFLGMQREFIPSKDFNLPGILLNNEPVVVNQFESMQYKDFLNWAKKNWDEGLVDKDSLFSKSSVAADANTDVNVIGSIGNPPEGALGDQSEALARLEPGASVDFVSLEGEGFKMISSFKAGNFIVISPTTKNAERVLKFLNLLYVNKEIRDLYLYGIEGEDFIAVGDNQYKYPDGMDQTKVFNNQWWMVTPWSNTRISASASETDKRYIAYLSDPNNFQKSVIAGFEFDPDPVKSDISKVVAVITEYRKILESGSGTTEQMENQYKEFINKMKKAGSDKIIAEKQRQIDEFLKGSKG